MLRATSVVSRLASRSFSLSASRSAEQPTKKEVRFLFSFPSQLKVLQFDPAINGFSLNRVEIIGGVANDPVFKTAKNDRPYAIVNVITNSRQRLANGEYRDQTERHTITAFGRTAEFVANNIKRGTRVLVNARLHYTGGQLDDQGVRSPRQTHLHAETIQPLARGGGGGGGGSDGASESS
ncbi:unnamed protein product [Haemonchus placei]|uniref:Single-stranded DNA-binding protein n=1 Tax=Haemonchus placei TaxID=6290 RepID=A0A0N4VSY3_HAEPC|nr:unnamed protein product [Haemonchus placei]